MNSLLWLGSPQRRARPDHSSQTSPKVTYGSSEFDAASNFWRLVGSQPGRLAKIWAVAARADAHARAIRYARSVPTVELTDCIGTKPRTVVGRALARLRFDLAVQAVVEIPSDPATFLVGRSRQALRTNIRRAQDHGVTYEPLAATDDDASRLRDFLDSRDWDVDLGVVLATLQAGAVAIVALDADGAIVGAVVASASGECATLVASMVDHGDAAFYARYGLHYELIKALSSRGVRHLVAGPALTVDRRLQTAHHLLGFRPVRLLTPR